jgi:hypothetical protein
LSNWPGAGNIAGAGTVKHSSNQRFSVLIALFLAGCSGTFMAPPPRAPVASWQVPVSPAFAAALGSDTTTGIYSAVDGSDMTLTLGSPYISARGQTCRIGRREHDRFAYGFCRNGATWYAIPPALVSED